MPNLPAGTSPSNAPLIFNNIAWLVQAACFQAVSLIIGINGFDLAWSNGVELVGG